MSQQLDLRNLFLLLFLVFGLHFGVEAKKKAEPKAEPEKSKIEQGLETWEKRDGFLGHYLDPKEGKVYLEIPAGDTGEVLKEMLWVESLRSGLGSNPIGLDRGQLGPTRWLQIREVGGKILFELPNLSYRADTENQQERTAVRDSFARSVIWAAPIEHRFKDGRRLIDLSPFLLRDAHGVVRRLKQTKQGAFSLSSDSVVDLDAALSFPKNTEFEAWLTFQSEEPGREVVATAATPYAFTLIAHHSFIELPKPGYTPRAFDPRTPAIPVRWADYAVPLDQSLETQWITRHRLIKKNPGPAPSEVVKPIVYYVDPGAPEPVRTALVEGAMWWADAFEAAGFKDAYRVELLPEGAHPLDVRYNVIQWVHRQTRGWSYGGGIVDPRTGEILKGHVSLGSLRVRQDIRIFEGLMGAANSGNGNADDPIQLALARIRQLSAHEVGHTLGFTHNFAASVNDRASVMDYPAPYIKATETGQLDASEAYAVGIGDWDVFSVQWSYQEFEPGKEQAGLNQLLASARAAGLLYVADPDARPIRSLHPKGSLWDNGPDPVASLENVLRVRQIAMENFGLDRLPGNRSMSELEQVFVPIYLYHRYQLLAAAKVLGGVSFEYAFAGEGKRPTPVAGQEQRRALAVMLKVLTPEALDVPEHVLEALSPAVATIPPTAERFDSRARPAFAVLDAAAVATQQWLDIVWNHERLQRVFEQHRRDPSLPGLKDVLDQTIDQVLPSSPPESPAKLRAVRHQIATVVVDHLIDLTRNSKASTVVQAFARAQLARLEQRLKQTPSDSSHATLHQFLLPKIQAALTVQLPPVEIQPNPLDIPPGSPIGMDVMFADCGFETWGW